jgi:hypothetical protein
MENLSWENLSGSGTFTLKSGPGYLHTLVINSTAAGAITLYDNTSAAGKKIAILKSNVVEGTYLYDLSFTDGLTIVLAAASDITVSFS